MMYRAERFGANVPALGGSGLIHHATAIDAAEAYPQYGPFVTGATEPMFVRMGGCILICGFDGQQQTAFPATITGTITSAPIAVAGTVIPRYTFEALDGSKAQGVVPNLWTLAMPLFNASPTMFSTVAATCGGTFSVLCDLCR